MSDVIVDKLSAMMHKTICDEKEHEGYHLPAKCPNFEKQYDEENNVMDADLIHCSYCDPNMGEFDDLENFAKETYKKKAILLLDNMKEFGLTIIEV